MSGYTETKKTYSIQKSYSRMSDNASTQPPNPITHRTLFKISLDLLKLLQFMQMIKSSWTKLLEDLSLQAPQKINI